ncbi:hypothetical protein AD931_06400 [Gluconobacter oxydans]|uniref:Uncharacterized protein n=1 Tax=Gluconobacter oxydans TaxID=442 RepID=A0AB34XMI2_GLUOY|nr:hypothetical protein AD931_06400 [Gluconobacter oxydans]
MRPEAWIQVVKIFSRPLAFRGRRSFKRVIRATVALRIQVQADNFMICCRMRFWELLPARSIDCSGRFVTAMACGDDINLSSRVVPVPVVLP